MTGKKFKNGIICGLLIIICSISNIMENLSPHRIIFWIYLFTLLFGIIQCVISLNYKKSSRKILLFCFALEGIYYIIATIFLLTQNAALTVKILGSIIAICILLFILISIQKLLKSDSWYPHGNPRQIQNAAYNGTIFLRSSNAKFFAESLIA